MSDMQKECILILGMHRSGTSVLTGLISSLGADLGSDIMPPTQDNPKGYFENNHIYNLNRKILHENGADWDSATFNISAIDSNKREAYTRQAEEILITEFNYVHRISIKDPRVCLLFPIWESALKNLNIAIKVILPIRSPLEVARSLMKRDNFSIEKSIQLWASHVLKAEQFSRAYPRQYITYPQDYANQDDLIRKLSDLIGIHPDENIRVATKKVYSPALTHHQIGFGNLSDLPHVILKLVSCLEQKETLNHGAYDKIREEFYHEQKFYNTPLDKDILKKEKVHEELLNVNNEISEQNQALFEGKAKQEKITLELVNQNEDLVEANKALLEENEDIVEANKALLEENRSFQSRLINKQKTSEEYKENRDKFVTRLKSDISKLLEKIKKIECDYHSLKDHRDLLNRRLKEKNKLSSQFELRLNNAIEIIDTLSTKERSKGLLNHIDTKKLSRKYQKKWYWPIQRKPLATRRKLLIAESGLFSPAYYLASYPDVRKSGMPPLEHFYKFGWKEGRSPSQGFNPKNYLRVNPDVAQSGMNPLLHYISHGKNEGRDPLPKIKQPDLMSPRPANQKTLPAVTLEKTALPESTNFGPKVDRDWRQRIEILKHLHKYELASTKNDDIPKEIISELKRKTAEIELPLISIIMPCWNREGVIDEAINSVLSQSYNNIELIISDDGSTDNTCQDIERNFSELLSTRKIKLIRNKHKGVCAARNSGLAAAAGDFIAYLDSDNKWREHFVLIMVNAFLENDELYCAYSALLSHDNNRQSKRILSQPYDREKLLISNFIDLNVFMHRACLYQQYGGFDETLTRLVDWELIIRYTKHHGPAYLPFIGVDYYLDHQKFKNITTSVSLDDNREKIYKRHFSERLRHGLEPLRLAYVLWDFPALSQTFVINELRWLVANNYDVNVYYAVDPEKAATLDFEIKSYQAKTSEELIPLLQEHNRNYCHSHFAYPAVTKLTWPACSELKLPFSFMPHAVDIFHHENQKRNHVGEIAQSPLCKKIFVHGPYHKNFLEKQGVPSEKMAYNFQAVNLDEFLSPVNSLPAAEKANPASTQKIHKGIVLSRFVEKKGISSLIDAAALLKDEPVCFELYGYGPLESDYRDQIEQLKLTNIRLMGALENKEAVRDLYTNSDFLIAPCIEAKNGDRDGFPTVILEAFSMGMPVITTNIAAVPDYLTDEVQALIAPAADTKALADKVKQLIKMPANRQQALTRQAQHFLQTKVGTHLSMSLLTDEWLDKRIDIFLVSFNNDQYDDEAETLEIIRRIFAYTTTPFTLTIIDNNSDESFWLNILEKVEGRDNVRLIRKEQNLMCGPSSNIALEMGDGEFAIYICAKEGFVAQHGWERALLNSMREHPSAALGGHHAHMPKYVYGHEYETHPDFSKYRNKDFLIGRLDKAFTHIQGGVFIIRREVFVKHGGFNPLIPHGGMDIELSYYYESLGYELLEIPEVASLTVKTRPTLTAIMDENTVVAHPLTIEAVHSKLDAFAAKTTKQCNLCGWQGKSFGKELHCPKCQSTPEGRLVYQYIASDYRIYRKGKALLLGKDEGLENALKPLFMLQTNSDPSAILTTEKDTHFSCIIIPGLIQNPQNLRSLYEILDDDGILIVVDDGSNNNTLNHSLPPVYYSRRSNVIDYTWKHLSIIQKDQFQ